MKHPKFQAPTTHTGHRPIKDGKQATFGATVEEAFSELEVALR